MTRTIETVIAERVAAGQTWITIDESDTVCRAADDDWATYASAEEAGKHCRPRGFVAMVVTRPPKGDELAALACAVAGLRKAQSYRDPSAMIDACLKEIARLMGLDAEDAK